MVLKGHMANYVRSISTTTKLSRLITYNVIYEYNEFKVVLQDHVTNTLYIHYYKAYG